MARQEQKSRRFARDREASAPRRTAADGVREEAHEEVVRPGAGEDAERAPMNVLRRWPAVLWILVYVGSVLILNGSNGKWDPLELALGIGLALVAFGLGMYLAFGPWPGGRPITPGMRWLIGGVALFYGVCALAAALLAGFADAVATLLAGIVPMTAAALWVAMSRSKTIGLPENPQDASVAASDDPFPGVGADDQRPLGDTPEAHGELSPHDLPKDHPGRAAAEDQAEELGGTTPGHREGGATGEEDARGADAGGDLVGRDEEDGARFRR
ncbi:MAG: hypothetical protein QOD55_2846 [Solirubrobacteraceae bacterium]|nr:hypothetical protein [Solirubrobacteraceae bacterium]